MTTRQTFAEAVEDFVTASPWLGPEHAPATAVLWALAEELDAGPMQAALVAQFGLTFRNLAKLAPRHDDGDELDSMLNDAQAAVS